MKEMNEGAFYVTATSLFTYISTSINTMAQYINSVIQFLFFVVMSFFLFCCFLFYFVAFYVVRLFFCFVWWLFFLLILFFFYSRILYDVIYF